MATPTPNTSDTNTYCDVLNCTFSSGERYLIISSLFLVMAVSLAGNIPILVLILRSKKKRNSPHLATLNLVVSDLLITVFCTPFVTVDMFVIGSWVFGRTMCRIVTFVQNTATLASVMNLLTLTCEKFLAVRFPFRFRLRKKVVYHLMPIAWIVAMTDSIVYMQFKRLKSFNDDKLYCIEEWPDIQTLRRTSIAKSSLFFGPLIIIIVLHSITMYELHRGKRKFQLPLEGASGRGSAMSMSRKQRKQKKAAKIILVSLITVIICWAPMQVFQVLMLFEFAQSFSTDGVVITFVICIWLFFCHCSASPFVYFFMTQKGKETIAACSGLVKGRRQHRYSSKMASTLLENSNTMALSIRGSARSSTRQQNPKQRAESCL